MEEYTKQLELALQIILEWEDAIHGAICPPDFTTCSIFDDNQTCVKCRKEWVMKEANRQLARNKKVEK